MDWTFPHKTCEVVRKHHWMEQPYSCVVNLMTVCFLFYYFFMTKTFWTSCAILSFLSFELFHAYCHAQHIGSHIQLSMIHFLSYLFAVCLFFCLKKSKPLSQKKLYFLLFFFILDVSVFLFSKHKIFQVLTGFLLLISIVSVFLPTIPLQERPRFILLIVLAIVITLQIILESMYCQVWMSWHPFPYHILIELIGLFAFVLLAHSLVRLENYQ